MDDLYVARKLIAKKSNADQRGIEFKLSFTAMKNLLSSKKCYYTGVPLTSEPDKANSLTIDRIDSSKGYVSGNVVACSKQFNQLKEVFDKAGKQGMMVAAKAFTKAAKRFEE